MSVPPWGCPWHGLVKGGSLSLPNGDVLTYPQPDLQGITPGDTALIAHPAAPGVPPLTDADESAGRQWWNKAILAGGQSLHGVFMRGWLYIDPNGEVWEVEAPVFFEDVTSLTLRRFGVLSGKPESYTYDYTVPNLGSTPALSLNSSRYVRWHTNATGAKACYARVGTPPASSLAPSGYLTCYGALPIGWFEIELAGPGRECIVTCTLLKNRADTLGNPVNSDTTNLVANQAGINFNRDIEDTRIGFPTCSGRRTEVWNPEYGYGAGSYDTTLGTVQVGGGTWTRASSGRVLAMFYDATDTLKSLTCDCEFTRTVDAPAPSYSVLASYSRTDTYIGATDDACITETELQNVTEVQVTRVSYCTDALRLELKLDGVTVASDVRQATRELTAVITYRLNGETLVFGTPSYVDQTFAYSPGGSTSDHQDLVTYPSTFPIALDVVSAAVIDETGMCPGYGLDWNTEPVEARPMRFSNALHGIIRRNGTSYATEAVVTPAGAVAASETDTVTSLTNYPKYYGSWCPYTDAVTLDTEMICYV